MRLVAAPVGFDSQCADYWHRFKNASYKETQMFVENLLSFAAEFVVLAFAAVVALDFALGLHRLWKASGTHPEPQKQRLGTLLYTVIKIQPQRQEALELPVVADPWLVAADATPTCCHIANAIAAPRPLLLLPPAQEVVEQPELDLTALKLYKLHGHSVVRVADLPVEIPATIKRYKLHKKDVVRLIDLEHSLAAL